MTTLQRFVLGLVALAVLMLIGPAFAIALLVYPDSVLTGRSLATVSKYRLSPNREFFGIGAANVGSGLLTGFPVNGSQSRSFVVLDSGARSQISSLWASLFVVLTLLLLAWVFEYLPSAALAGIVIVAGLGLLDVTEPDPVAAHVPCSRTRRPMRYWRGHRPTSSGERP